MAPQVKAGRTILGVIAGYTTNAMLVWITEALYGKFLDPRKYFVADLITQVFATIVGGFLCCLIARRGSRNAAITLTILGLVVGCTSLAINWSAEPHWYGILLLSAYSPCVWIGYALTPREGH